MEKKNTDISGQCFTRQLTVGETGVLPTVSHRYKKTDRVNDSGPRHNRHCVGLTDIGINDDPYED